MLWISLAVSPDVVGKKIGGRRGMIRELELEEEEEVREGKVEYESMERSV